MMSRSTPTEAAFVSAAKARRIIGGASLPMLVNAALAGSVRVQIRPGSTPRYNVEDCRRLAAELGVTAPVEDAVAAGK